jgi:endonuclease/exonuclease/phosphatase (EEP) superfamily protein YafD
VPARASLPVSTGRVLAWTLVLVALTATAARWVDVAWSPLVMVQSVSAYAAVPALLGVLGLLLPGRLATRAALGSVAVVVVLVQGAIWLPWLTDQEPRAGRHLTVLSSNVYRGRADLGYLARVARSADVDVLVLSEVTPRVARSLRDRDIVRRFPHEVVGTSTPGATVILSRLPLTPVRGLPAGVRNPTARLAVDGRVLLRAVHPPPPTESRVHGWRGALRALSAWARQTSGPTVVAGDFNASADHPGLRALLDAGFRDAHELSGAGRPPTWPHGRTLPAFVHIDHVLVRGVDVASLQTLRVPGSDHSAVLADLVLPAAAGPTATP